MQKWQDHARVKINGYKQALDGVREEKDRLREVSEFSIKASARQNLTEKVKSQSEEKKQLLEQLNAASSESSKFKESAFEDFQAKLIVLTSEKTEAERKAEVQGVEVIELLLNDMISRLEFGELVTQMGVLSSEISSFKGAKHPSIREVLCRQRYLELQAAFNEAKAKKAQIQQALQTNPDSRELRGELAKVSNELERLVYAMDAVRQEAAAEGIALETGPLRANTIIEKRDDAVVRRLERELELANSEVIRMEGLLLAKPFINSAEDLDRIISERNEAQAQAADLRAKLLSGADVPAEIAQQVAANEAEKLRLREELSRSRAEYEIKLASLQADSTSHRTELKKLKSKVMAPGANIESIQGSVNESAAWSAILAERDAAKAEAEALKTKLHQDDNLAEFYHKQLKELEESSRAAQAEAFSKASKAEAQAEKLQTENSSLKADLERLREAMLQGADAAQASVSSKQTIGALIQDRDKSQEQAGALKKQVKELKDQLGRESSERAETQHRSAEELRQLKMAFEAKSIAQASEIEALQKENASLRSVGEPSDDGQAVQLTMVAVALETSRKRASELEGELSVLKTTPRSDPEELHVLKKQIVALQQSETQLQSALTSKAQEVEAIKAQAESQHTQALSSAAAANAETAAANAQALSSLKVEHARQHEELKSTQAAAHKATEDLEAYKKKTGDIGALKASIVTLTAEVATLQKNNALKEQELKDSIRQRKLLHNQLEDLKGKIRVFCRVRPMSRSEVERACTNVLTISDDFTIHCETRSGQVKPFMYDSVFGPSSTQEQVFEDTTRLIQSAVDGYNVCIFAYGQTGSGKTYTIQGTPDNPGVTPRAMHEMFGVLQRLPEHYDWKVTCYMVELYLDVLVDLFLAKEQRAGAPTINIKKDAKGMVILPEATIKEVFSPEEILARYDEGTLQRHTEKTKMNDTSSRSHLVFGIFIDVTNNQTNQRTVGKLSLVDLAGSERVSKTDATAERLKEGRAINKSLSALGDVIAALSAGESHIPYRNHKLTMLMSDSLGGTAKTLMFVNVSPASYNREETNMSLYYAARVKLITNDPTKNVESREMSKVKQELTQVTIERDRFKEALQASGIGLDSLPPPRVEAEAEDDSRYDEAEAEDDSRYDEA
jgi:hypothetical protein